METNKSHEHTRFQFRICSTEISKIFCFRLKCQSQLGEKILRGIPKCGVKLPFVCGVNSRKRGSILAMHHPKSINMRHKHISC